MYECRRKTEKFEETHKNKKGERGPKEASRLVSTAAVENVNQILPRHSGMKVSKILYLYILVENDINVVKITSYMHFGHLFFNYY